MSETSLFFLWIELTIQHVKFEFINYLGYYFYYLRAGPFEVQIPAGASDFSPQRPDGSGVNPASYAMGTRGKAAGA